MFAGLFACLRVCLHSIAGRTIGMMALKLGGRLGTRRKGVLAKVPTQYDQMFARYLQKNTRFGWETRVGTPGAAIFSLFSFLPVSSWRNIYKTKVDGPNGLGL